MEIFCQSVVVSAVYFAAICWENSIGADDANRLNKLIRISSDWLDSGHF